MLKGHIKTGGENATCHRYRSGHVYVRDNLWGIFGRLRPVRRPAPGIGSADGAGILYGVARAVGLADPGRGVNPGERSVRRKECDRERVEALHRDTEGTLE